MQVRTAVLSVYDKEGIVDFARGLAARGVRLISTGGTHRLLREADVPVAYVSEVTGFPEVLDGRVKTLHPKVHAGILARRALERDMRQLEELGIAPIDLVAVNLYPFEAVTSKPGVSLDEALENIDIGGPTLVRAAAKNFPGVVVVVDPRRYGEVLERLDRGALDLAFREELAKEAFAHTAAYDRAIHAFFESRAAKGGSKK